jgi:hypothetical protein
MHPTGRLYNCELSRYQRFKSIHICGTGEINTECPRLIFAHEVEFLDSHRDSKVQQATINKA